MTVNRQWTAISKVLPHYLPSQMYTLKQLYEKYLMGYERLMYPALSEVPIQPSPSSSSTTTPTPSADQQMN